MRRSPYYFSRREIIHLTISVIVMSILVSYSWFGYSRNIASTLVGIGVGFLIIAPAFVFHELGHKFVSQSYGYFAEYRMWTQGLLFAILVTIISSGKFIFIAPGAVYFGGGFARATLEKTAKIGLAGPIVNLILSAIFGLIGIFASGLLAVIGSTGAYVNAWLAIFNLIPFPPLDGQKIFAWNIKVWALVLVIAIVAFIGCMSI